MSRVLASASAPISPVSDGVLFDPLEMAEQEWLKERAAGLVSKSIFPNATIIPVA